MVRGLLPRWVINVSERRWTMATERTEDTQQQDRRDSATQSGQQATGAQQGGNGQQGGITRRERRQASPAFLAGPFSLMRQLMEDLDLLAAGGTAASGASSRRSERDALWVPTIEVSEADGQLVVRADIPGVDREQIEVEIDDGQLIISGERKEEHEERRGGIYRTEVRYGRFHRAIPLPDGAHPEQAQATFNNGVVEIRIPRPARQQAQRVQVQDGTSRQQSSANEA